MMRQGAGGGYGGPGGYGMGPHPGSYHPSMQSPDPTAYMQQGSASMMHHQQQQQMMMGNGVGQGQGQPGMGPPTERRVTFNNSTRMEHIANNTLNNRTFGTILPGSHGDNEVNGSVVRQIQMDWDNRQYLEAITLGIKKITDFLNRFDLSCQTRLAHLNERLSNLERQLDYIQAKLPANSAPIPVSNS